MSLGFGLLSAQKSPGDERGWRQLYAQVLELAEHAERAGFDSVWTSEHHFVDDGYMPSLLVTSAAIAARTTTIAIGTGVVLAPLHHPLRLAEDAATVQLLSGGRLILGLGLGWSDVEFEAFGADLSKRGKDMDEILDILPRAWSGRPFHWEGERYRFPEIGVTPAPETPIPIVIGGSAPAAIRRAARKADGLFSNAPIDGYLGQVAIARDELDKSGRPAEDFSWIHYSVMYPCDDPARGWDEIADHVWHMTWKYSDMNASASRSGEIPKAPPLTAEQSERLRQRSILVDTPEKIVERLLDIRERSGVDTRFVARSHFPTMSHERQIELMDRLATEVAPHL